MISIKRTISGEGRERRRAHLLDLRGVRAGRERRGLADGGHGLRDGLRAVDEVGLVVARDGKTRHDLAEKMRDILKLEARYSPPGSRPSSSAGC